MNDTCIEGRKSVIEGWKAIGYIDYELDPNDEAVFWTAFNRFIKWKPVSTSASNRCYAITLTTAGARSLDDLKESLRRIVNSKSIEPTFYEWCHELTKNEVPHIHLYLETQSYIRCRDILRFNQNERIDCKTIKGLAITKWRNYIAKEMIPLTEV